MGSNRISVWKVMTIWISRELPLLNFEGLDILTAWIGPPNEKLLPFEFPESFQRLISSVSIYYVPESDICVKSYDHSNFSTASVVQFWESRYILSPNRTSVWNVMTIQISREHPLFNSELLDILFAGIGPPCDKLWPFEFLESFHCLISSISKCDAPASELRVKS